METKIANIKERILYYTDIKGLKKEKFFEDLGVTYGNFKGQAKNKALSSDVLAKIITNYSDINPEWLLTGIGSMLRGGDKIKPYKGLEKVPLGEGIPLIPVEAFAGAALNNGYAVDFEAIEERYNVPLFEGKGVDFMMYVRGSSMYPKYRSGDIVACRFVRELLFIQWNKVYIIDSKSQGAMIKRLLPSANPDHVICRSDNKEYIDFEVPLSDIQNIAMVIGCISLE